MSHVQNENRKTPESGSDQPPPASFRFSRTGAGDVPARDSFLSAVREVGVLYVNPRAKDRLWPSVVSLYAGAVGISRTHGALGQRDEGSIIGFGEALAFQQRIGAKVVESRSRRAPRIA